MKYILPVIFLIFTIVGCNDDDKANMPQLQIVEVFVNDDETNYADNLQDITGLTIGDKIDIKVLLDGNGADLMTLNVRENEGHLRNVLSYDDKDVTDDPNFTKPQEGTLVFVDGVSSSVVTIHTNVVSRADHYYYIHFYLSSKAQVEGAEYLLPLPVGAQAD